MERRLIEGQGRARRMFLRMNALKRRGEQLDGEEHAKACSKSQAPLGAEEIDWETLRMHEGFGILRQMAKLPYLRNVLHEDDDAEIRGSAEQPHSVVKWDALSMDEALAVLDRTAESPSVEGFIHALHRCKKEKKLENAKRLRMHACNCGLEAHRAMGSYIVPMLVDCGSVAGAREVFNRLVHRNQHCWTSLISGYVRCDKPQHAFILYQEMQCDGVHPTRHTLIALLKACARLKDLERGREIHLQIVQKRFSKDLFVGSTLLSMYARCGALSEAHDIFNRLPVRNVVCWTALIAGYSEQGHGYKVLRCFEQMQLEGVFPDVVTYICILKACGNIGAIDKGRQIHAEIARKGFDREPFVGNTLVDMYAKWGLFSEAWEVFDKLPVRDVVSWNVIIAGYVDGKLSQEALECFEQMQVEGVSPDSLTFVCALKACGSLQSIDKGREIHAAAVEKHCDTDAFVSSALVNMYAKCGSLLEAKEAFDKSPVKNVVTWTALIAGYAEHGSGQEALEFFEQMQLEGIPPNAVTFVCILKACGSIGALDKGRELHIKILQKGYTKILNVCNSLIDMYAKCGSLFEAREVFNEVSLRDVVSWNALLAGYAEHGPGQEVLDCFQEMQLEGIFPSAVTFVCVLKACGSIGALEVGRQMHIFITDRSFERELFIGSSLIDMYSKCGAISEACEVFANLPVQNIVSWNAMINGHCMNHNGNMAMKCFEDMRKQGMHPDGITFICLLTACSSSNLVSRGQGYFNMMKHEYGIVPMQDHYICMVDLLARSGHLYEAEKFMKTMVCSPSEEAWKVLLSACKAYIETDLGLRCFQQLVLMNPENAGPYVLMENIYQTAGKRENMCRIEELRKLAGAKKKPASALIEVNKKIYEFMVGDNQSPEILAMIETLNVRMKEDGNAPILDLVMSSISDDKKEAALCEHAERLAVAFGLLNTSQGQTLRVMKNLRMCVNCHNANKTISRIERREIIVRDSSCIHHFKDGLCSCKLIF